MFSLPYPYAVFMSEDATYSIVEMWNPVFRKYVVGYVFEGKFRAANEHLTKAQLEESWVAIGAL